MLCAPLILRLLHLVVQNANEAMPNERPATREAAPERVTTPEAPASVAAFMHSNAVKLSMLTPKL